MTLTVPSTGSPLLLLGIDLVAGRITVRGELDRHTAHQLVDAVSVLEHSPSPAWSIDASGISFCDTEGVRSLLTAKRHAASAGRSLAVLRPTPLLRCLMGMVALDLLESARPGSAPTPHVDRTSGR